MGIQHGVFIGRLNRESFAVAIGIYNVINIVVLQVAGIETFTKTPWAFTQYDVGYVVGIAAVLAYIVGMIIVNAVLILRRLHDIGIGVGYKDGQWDPIYLTMQPWSLLLLKGDDAENRWGKRPKSGIDLKSIVWG